MALGPAHRARPILHEIGKAGGREKSIARRHDHEALPGEPGESVSRALSVSALPSAAVKEDDDRVGAARPRKVEIDEAIERAAGEIFHGAVAREEEDRRCAGGNEERGGGGHEET